MFSFWKSNPPIVEKPVIEPIPLSNYDRKLIVERDKSSFFYRKRYEYNDRRTGGLICYIQYGPRSGQIGLIRVHNHLLYRRGLGMQMLLNAINDIIHHKKATEIWAFTNKDHPFWSNIFSGMFAYREPAHPSITGPGVFVSLKKLKAEHPDYFDGSKYQDYIDQ